MRCNAKAQQNGKSKQKNTTSFSPGSLETDAGANPLFDQTHSSDCRENQISLTDERDTAISGHRLDRLSTWRPRTALEMSRAATSPAWDVNHASDRIMAIAEGDSQIVPPQAQLRVSMPGDPYEEEAASAAEQVVGMGADDVAKPSAGVGLAHRITTSGVPAKDGSSQRSGSPQMSAPINSLRDGGEKLDGGMRAFMEPRFGHDFGRVRIHTDNRAANMAQALEAQAFTVGSDIAFAAGQYQPHSQAGRMLLAHELTHVVQQGYSAPFVGPATTVPANRGSLIVQRQPAASQAPDKASGGSWNSPKILEQSLTEGLHGSFSVKC